MAALASGFPTCLPRPSSRRRRRGSGLSACRSPSHHRPLQPGDRLRRHPSILGCVPESGLGVGPRELVNNLVLRAVPVSPFAGFDLAGGNDRPEAENLTRPPLSVPNMSVARRKAAILGALLADAATMPLHWVSPRQVPSAALPSRHLLMATGLMLSHPDADLRH